MKTAVKKKKDLLASLDLRTKGILRIPVEVAQTVEMRYASLLSRDHFNPLDWSSIPLQPSTAQNGFFELDLNKINLTDGTYEYEFILDGQQNRPVADPFAEEIVRFGGYRGIFRIENGKLWDWPFSWDDELSVGATLPQNRQLVIYEMPLRWMDMPPGAAQLRQVGLGTFDKCHRIVTGAGFDRYA